VIPWQNYVHYGSLDMLEDTYEGMKGYIRYMQTWVNREGIMFSKRTARDGSILKWFNLGEWEAPGKTYPDEMAHTFYLWYCATITARTAHLLGMEEEALTYDALAHRTKNAFHKNFYNEAEGSYGDGGGNVLALRMGVPESQINRVLESLIAGFVRNRGHLDTGILGTRFLFEVLAEHGLQELAYGALNKRTEPGFGHWVELGSTTTRERWDEGGSHNHPMFGGGLVWFYRNLAGMKADPTDPGYRHIIFRPQPLKELGYVSYWNRTPYGEGGIKWRNGEEAFTMDIKVPVSCTSTVFIPTRDPASVKEGGLNHREVDGIEFLRMEDGYAVFNVKSGEYSFSTVGLYPDK